MSRFRNVWLVAARDYRERGRSMIFLGSTALLVLLILAGVFGYQGLESVFGDADEQSLGTVDVPDDVATSLTRTAENFELELELRPFENEQLAAAALAEGNIDAVLIGASELRFNETEDSELRGVVNQAVGTTNLMEALQGANVPPAEIDEILSPEPVEVTFVDRDVDSDEDAAAAFAVGVLMFIAILTYGQWILTGVVNEKSNRVVEVLLSALRPWQLLTGKIVGILALAMSQLLVAAAVLVVALVATEGMTAPALSGLGFTATALAFVLGIFFYSALYGAAGSLASRQEDASNLSGPIGILPMAAYGAAVIVVPEAPNGAAAQVLTYFPPTAPVVAPVRVGLGEASGWEMGLAMLLLAAATIVVLWLAVRLYTGTVLRTGPRLGLSDAWRAIRGGAG